MNKKVIGFLIIAGLVYIFLLSINLMGAAFKLMGKDFASTLIKETTNPFIGLFIGILATSLVQSSSCTTSILVGLVAAGSITIRNAIPIVMGANIGTTITNIIVSTGHITRRQDYRRAVTGATVHDFFNLIAVAVLFPLEVTLHPIEYMAKFISPRIGHIQGAHFSSPLKLITQPVVESVLKFTQNPIVILVVALCLLFFSLFLFSKILRRYVSARAELYLEERVFNNPLKSFGIGILLTAVVQSSSCTTSLIIPLVAVGILTVEAIFPYVLGANLGTTVTALLAALATGVPASLTLAFSHLLFNIGGICIIYPVRKLPFSLSKWLGNLAYKKRYAAILFAIITFYVLPLLLVFITR